MAARRAPSGGAAPGSIGVMVVDDHAVVRQGLAAYLGGAEGLHLVEQAVDGRQAVDRLAALTAEGRGPEVVLMDLLMPRLDGVAATRVIAADHPGVKVVVLTSFGEGARIQAALEVGAVGYVLKDAEPEQIDTAVHTAMAGQVYLDPVVTRRLTRRVLASGNRLAGLTDREKEVLALVATGLSNQEIAERLVITERTARTHVSRILAKLGLRSRTQAALTAIGEGLVPAPGAEEA